MGRGKKFLSLFLAAAMAVTGISVGTPVTAQAAAETRETETQGETVDLVLEQFDGSSDQQQWKTPGRIIVSATKDAGNDGNAHNAAFVKGEETEAGTTFVAGAGQPDCYGSGGRVAAVRFKLAEGLTEEKIENAVLKLTVSEANYFGGGKTRLGVYETAVEQFTIDKSNNGAGIKDDTCAEGNGAFPAVNGDYSYAATMWSDFVQEKEYAQNQEQDGSLDQTMEVDVTRALKNAVKKGQSFVVLRLQIPTGGVRIYGLKEAGKAAAYPEKAPALKVALKPVLAPVTVKYMAVSGDDAIGEIKSAKQVDAVVGRAYTYEVPDSEKLVTADDGKGILTYKYVSSDPASLMVTADDGNGSAPKNVITLKYERKLADKSALQQMINGVDNYKEANYTPQTWDPFAAALTAAKAVMADEYATDADVKEALDRLTAAADALELSEAGKNQPATDADKAALTSYITGIETKYTSDAEYTVAYSKAARDAFAAAVAEAKGKVSTVNTLQDIETVKAALRTAEATLKAAFVTPYDGKAADIQALDAKITEAGDLLTDENKGKNETAYNALKAAKETAETAKNTALTTEVDKAFVTGATSTLNTAIETFKEAIETPVTPPGPGEDDVEITSVTLNHTTLEVAENGTETLTATIEPANATDKTLEWKADKTDVVKVESDGETGATVTGLKAGTATITVTTKNNKTATCDVTVTPAGGSGGEDEVEITGVKLDKTEASVKEKETLKLNATIEPANANTDKTLTWTSDKKEIAAVSQDGTVTGVKAGTATITVETKNGKTASCKVTVTPAGTGSGTGTGTGTETTDVKVSLDKTAVTLAAGKDITLKATVNPANAGSVSWTSSDNKIATVANGKVTAKKAGTAKITAAVGTKSAVCTVTVVSLSKTKVTLGVKEKITLKVNGTTKKVTWKTSNGKVAAVKNGKVTAKKANKKAINITATVDGVTLTCKVTVKAAPKKLILKGKKTVTVKKNKTVKLKVSLPKNTAGTLKYKSSNKKVAKVDAKGKVKGVKKGTAKITVTAANNKKAKVVVTVKVK